MSKLLKVRQFKHTFTRNVSEYVKTVDQQVHPAAEGTIKSFKYVTYFVCVPLWIISMVNSYLKEQEGHHEKPPEFVHYPYMKVMTKGFPWADGKHSLLHNPKRNYIPDVGYEEPVE
ncbi:hypothetical protein E2986_06867 [Frieseomelitta varia]|uniref:Cytochrome c oxidase subunit n=1 Tax=Frieseomelitta varia TaxID=561572 RepID=A0A833VU82_9HYME|nr:cytochrome c oxidase subunit 6A1, mitochondrial-like [Frieseomelitta varia]KAF3420254.1 hypothetical protein E2986_06867 [Frieseomelitta varia]